jgi:hypothetical protein
VDALPSRLVDVRDLAEQAVDAPDGQGRAKVHHLYLELGSFTGAYLEHQDVEERLVMPALESEIGPEAVALLHREIVGSISPPDMAATLAIMIPAINLDDRAELLGGIRAGAPAEVFGGIWGLTATVLVAADHAALAARLGLPS